MRDAALPASRLFSFVGGATGRWRIQSVECIVGDAAQMRIAMAARLSVTAGAVGEAPADAAWTLRGIISNERYVTRDERAVLVDRQQGLGRATAPRAALIPIRKTSAWWALSQDERRDIFEAQSHHIGIGLKYLPAIARRLHHCRDLGLDEPFDFLTWFEYAPADSAAFDALLADLRASPEWAYIDREIDIRLVRDEN